MNEQFHIPPDWPVLVVEDTEDINGLIT